MLVVGDHAGPVAALAFAPDGRGLASAAKDGTVRLWDLGGGSSIDFAGHTGPVHSVSISPGGDWIVTAGADRTARLWRLDGRPERVLGPFAAPVWGATFLAGGQYGATAVGNRLDAADPGGVQIYRLRDGSLVHRFDEPSGAWTLAAAPEHKRLAWSNGYRRVVVWELTAQDRHIFPPLRFAAVALAMSNDARLLAVGDDWAIRVFDIARREEIAALAGHKGRVTTLAFTPDGRQLLSGGGDQRVITWDIAGRQEQQAVDWDIGRVNALAVSSDGLLCAAAGDRGRVIVWDRE